MAGRSGSPISCRRGTIDEWADIVVPLLIITFIFFMMYSYTFITKSTIENRIMEERARGAAAQEIINFLRTPLKDAVTGELPEDTQGMSFGEFFIWHDSQLKAGSKPDDKTMAAVRSAIRQMFGKTHLYGENREYAWNLKVTSSGKYIVDSGFLLGRGAETTTVILPSADQKLIEVRLSVLTT